MVCIDEAFKQNVGIRLKQLRKKYKYSINILSEKLSNEYFLNIDEKTIRRYEKGDFLPKIDNLIVFAELFNTTLDYLVFGRETSDDNSFTWFDTLKRLNRLIYSLVLIPELEENKDSLYYHKYFFLSSDEELKLYIDKLVNFMGSKKYMFDYRSFSPYFDIHDMDALIQEFSEFKEKLVPSETRLKTVLYKLGINPSEYHENRIKEIKEKRNYNRTFTEN